MSDLEEAKRLVGKAVGLEPPCFHCMGKGYLTKSMECPKCKGNTLSIMAYVSHIRENANNALSLLENMKEEVNRADGPKSPCCGVPMVWINSRQRYICPNCGNYPSEKPAEERREHDRRRALAVLTGPPDEEPGKQVIDFDDFDRDVKERIGHSLVPEEPEKSYEDSEIVELRRKIHTEEPVCTCGHPISAHVMEPIDDLSICQLCPHGECKDFSIHTNGKIGKEDE